MYWLNKIVWMAVNPLAIGLELLLLALLLCFFETAARSARFSRMMKYVKRGLIFFTLAWFWMWSSPAWTRIIGGSLEKEFLVKTEAKMRMKSVSDYPETDAIVDLGGGCGGNTNMVSMALLNAGADRAYFSSLLWKAGKAPFVIPSGTGMEFSDKVFLKDLGVPESAILLENKARNTEENARCVAKLLNKERPRILLVTSAWHMKRSLLMFGKYAPDVICIPAACDFESDVYAPLVMKDFIPDIAAFERNCRFAHEWIGIVWYKYIRR